MKKIKIGGIKILTYITCLFLIGCSTPKPEQNPFIIASYTLSPVKINIVESVDVISSIYGRTNENVYAFYDPNKNTVWVPKNPFPDENGKLMPNLFLLGHEVWHSVELNYHSNTNTVYSYPIIPGYSSFLLKDPK